MGISKFTPEQKARNPRAVLRFNFWLFEQLSFDPQVQVNGLVVINTFKSLTFFEQMGLSNIASVSDQLATFQHFQTLGMRFKAAYMLEEPPFISWLWYFIQPFMSGKIKSRFFLCGKDYSKLQSGFQDISILPLDIQHSYEPAIVDPFLLNTEWLKGKLATRQ
jgi:hypothetical protein